MITVGKNLKWNKIAQSKQKRSITCITTWAICNSPASPSCDSHKEVVVSWCQWAHLSSPPMGAEGSLSGRLCCHQVRLLCNLEMRASLWRLVSKLPGTFLLTTERQQQQFSFVIKFIITKIWQVSDWLLLLCWIYVFTSAAKWIKWH